AAAALARPGAALAAQLRVVSLLSGEAAVCTVVDRRRLVEATVEGTWADLVAACAEAPPLPRCDQPGLGVTYTGRSLLVEYDTARYDAGYAARLAGYLTAALTAVGTDPERPCTATDLLSEAERADQLHGRSGPAVTLPDRPVHELIAQQARATPEAPAVIAGGVTWSHARLDAAADRVARWLLARGVAAEEVVALAASRGPEWTAAIIGILRAGAAYLPIEADHPPARVATLLERAGARLLLTDDTLAEVLTGPAPEPRPFPEVGPGRLAYVYFTSGSTGLPKGAMCEHAGMANHLLAKIRDFALGAGDRVVQNARASFDISLWQALAPLLTGGASVTAGRDEVLDVPRFLRTLADGGATVLQLVPSYLDVLLTHLERHGLGLGGVHTVSVTGEAVPKALVLRLLRRCPGIRLINAYGATEASDDTTHEVITTPPAEELVPVGVPIANVTVTVLGPGDTLVPLGSPGEITFTGVCVGRGYVNEPGRTAEVFTEDPLRPGRRMYRTGDYGRWLPTGHLEFHGRRDEQVKVHGVRIELGEVEGAMLTHPAVRAACVVVTTSPAGKGLAGFYTGAVAAADLAAHLATVLPAASVPAALHPVDALPVNANGKVDRRALTELAAARPAPTADGDPPRTETERRIAAAWAGLLDRPVESIGREDHFFELGGSSLAALRLVAGLGGLVSLDDLVRNPVLAALAAAADGTGRTGTVLRLLAGPATGAALALVCLPYAAGAAITFRPLAAALTAADPRVAVYALQAPGHDLGRRDEPLSEQAELAKLLADEVAGLAGDGTPVVLWGHSSGAALAIDLGQRLGARVRHVFLGARLLESPAQLTAEVATVTATTDHALASSPVVLEGLADVELSDADLAFVGRVYRHDTRCANQFLLAGADTRLSCPVTVVVGRDDPLTAGYRDRYARWREFAADVRLAELDGGHLFCRTHPAEVAALVLGRAVSGDGGSGP
ncbi:MAG TPA: amino acid adenylation domain-containing protein, partial [Pseudonocardiaceae bacterium]